MIVLVLTATPPGLRGDLTKWLLEISPGVFVGNVNKRVREKLWERVCSMAREGRALMVHSSGNEQRLEFHVHDHHWEPTDLDGITVMKRPTNKRSQQRKTGWSAARGQVRSRRASWMRRYDPSNAETTSETS
ncbi:type I-E CRISPR-associated endoribonuclease Cas2e [Nesterenkonia sp. CL21]|uniref:type I-E CRISPR-associated endoribonuclease Cas2e n=1 Tax=Nesterenkonia sp. CL21 TaxID=3064894 RepID=UPI00287A2477|nr:type I-E CRISPR-associated endoribonuclease Cas2e [Nesterenkonia sp. CL21]MDS2172671.1 type I-E CRISPR-associated endoribonuclease Cas2e [Nesterenkonia sp. CL21]